MSDEIMYRGKRLEDLSREELIEAFKRVFKDYSATKTPDAIEAYAIGRVEMMKRSFKIIKDGWGQHSKGATRPTLIILSEYDYNMFREVVDPNKEGWGMIRMRFEGARVISSEHVDRGRPVFALLIE